MKLLDQIRQQIRVKHYSIRTEDCYVRWAEQFIRFHKGPDGFRHPRDLGPAEVERFLTYLAVDRHVSASTQNQALAAILFLYQEVLHLELTGLDAVRAQRSRRLPVVLTRAEVAQLLAALDALATEEPYALMARLMYGAGLRLMESCRLRVKDIDLDRRQITVRQGKGDKDRVVMLPSACADTLAERLRWRHALHHRDRNRNLGWVWLPDALDVKFPEAPFSVGWQYVFASTRLSQDPRSGNQGRHHVAEAAVQRAVAITVRDLKWTKRVSCHTLRHYAACQLMPTGVAVGHPRPAHRACSSLPEAA
jgi:integron integrase